MKLWFLPIFLMLSSMPVDAGDWYGLFTTDRIPVDNCQAVNTTGAYKQSRWILRSDGVEKGESYGESLMNALSEAVTDLEATARKAGWHALVGYRETVTPYYEGFGGSSINGSRGYGGAMISVSAVPIEVTCK